MAYTPAQQQQQQQQQTMWVRVRDACTQTEPTLFDFCVRGNMDELERSVDETLASLRRRHARTIPEWIAQGYEYTLGTGIMYQYNYETFSRLHDHHNDAAAADDHRCLSERQRVQRQIDRKRPRALHETDEAIRAAWTVSAETNDQQEEEQEMDAEDVSRVEASSQRVAKKVRRDNHQ